MPQDKVGDFSRFTPKDMLSHTLKSVHKPSDEFCLADEQHALSQIQDAKEEYRRKRDAKRTALDAAKKELDSMRAELDRMQRRDKKLKLLEEYGVRLLTVEIEELEAKFNEKEAAVKEKEEQLKIEKGKITPLEDVNRDLLRQQQVRDKTADAAKNKQGLIDESLRGKKDTIATCDVDVDDASNQLLLLARTRATKERERETALQRVAEVEREEAMARALIPNLNIELARCKEEGYEINDRKNAIDDRNAELQQKQNVIRDEILGLNRDMGGLQDFKQNYRTKLLNSPNLMMRQAVQALDWIEQNRGRLRGEVLGPVAMFCDVEDPACAAMLEKAIPQNKLMGFVCDNDQDRNLLKHELRVRQKLAIDIFTMKRINVDNRRSYSEQQLQQLGMKGYLCDQIQCPDIIRSMFYCFHGLHQILWGRGVDNLSHEQQVRMCQQEGSFKLYIHEVTERARSAQQGMSIIEYKGKRSRNPHAPPSTSSIAIRTTDRYLCNQAGGEDVAVRRAALEHNLTDAKQRLKQVEADVATQINLSRQLNEESRLNRVRQSDLSAALKQPDALKRQLDTARANLTRIEKDLAASSNRDKKVATYRESIRALLGAVKDAVTVAEKSTAQRVDRLVALSVQDELRDAIRGNTDALRDAKRGVQEITRELAHAEKVREDAYRRFGMKEAELNAIIANSGLTVDEYGEQVFAHINERCPENTVAEIIARIDALNDEINKIADNPQLQQRFEEVTVTAQRLEAELGLAVAELENAEESLGERSKRWSDTVERIADKLHAKFSAFMEDLQLGGSVELKKIGKFDDYELQLSVRFRDGQDLCPLDGSKHSGGERAVSTVMFLMALQGMTTSPFRVVDEINQGMDESNERLVFDRVVKSCCGVANKSQYFLVTPKLLQGLGAMNNEDVTVLLVWNGPGTTKKWTFSQVLQKLSQGEYTGASEVTMDDFEVINHSAAKPSSSARGTATAKAATGARQKRRIVESEDEEEHSEVEADSPVVASKRARLVSVKKQKD